MRLDPGFVSAYLKLGELTWRPTVWGQGSLSAEQAFVQSSALIATAERQSPGNLEVIAARGMNALVGSWDWPKAFRDLNQVRMQGQPTVGLAWYLSLIEGRYNEAIDVLDELLVEDPQNVTLLATKARVARFEGNWAEATALFEAIGEATLEWPHLLDYSDALLRSGRQADARKILDRALEESESHPAVLIQSVIALAASGKTTDAAAAMREIERVLAESEAFPTAKLGLGYIALGAIDDAVMALETGFDEKGSWSMLELRSAVLLNALGDDPRYWSLVDSMQFPELPVYHRHHQQEQRMRARNY